MTDWDERSKRACSVVCGLSFVCGKADVGMPPTVLSDVTWSPRFQMSTCAFEMGQYT